jgi:hypothetical protein
LRPKAAEVAKLRALPPPEDDIDPDGAVSSTIVEDSDDEEFELPAPAPSVPTPAPVVETVADPVVAPAAVKKRVVAKKKE